ncbi:RimK family alpha-L-glutamate ligase [Streptomyces sp. NBC_01363]|uniref:ATP-grasp domain-containing protein n=1 Tax=Streptomyces sp. NBC_01363 TaxID=2903840 RepID=UPI002255194F|nr:alpha-L-glutamate ligase [Streptomyces sp. NBC_01363]MCX4735980.1 alpha-L-glutamate ligase [Streptomyces sp. NBC_01363]
MRVCLLTDKPDHPLLAAVSSALTEAKHRVTFLNPDTGTGSPSQLVTPDDLADVYLLKAHTPRALALARFLEARGARVLNSAASTELCQDRSRIAAVAEGAGLPMPRTSTLDALSEAVHGAEPAESGFPLMVKSRHSRRTDLVARVDGPAELRDLAAEWPNEPVVLQEFVANSGWDHKLWVIAGEVFAGVRPAPVGVPPDGTPSAPLVRDLPQTWTELALHTGEVFGLDVYGVDLLDREGAPVAVDINAFPGIRGPKGAPAALAALVLRRSRPRADAPPCRSSC